MIRYAKLCSVICTLLILVFLISSCTQKPVSEKEKPIGFQASFDIPKELPLSIYQNLETLLTVTLVSKRPIEINLSVQIDDVIDKEIIPVDVSNNAILLRIKPELKKDTLSNINSSRNKKLIVSITDKNGKVLEEIEKKIKILPSRDMVWVDNEGFDTSYHIASWSTPETDKIKEFIKTASKYTPYNAMLGYQEVDGYSNRSVTSSQIKALYEALVKDFKLTYINTPISTSGNNAQNILLPADVLTKASGNCIELTMTMASALEALGFEPFIILTTGHSMVAVREWPASDEYFFVETTALDASPDEALAIGKSLWLDALDKDDVINVIEISKIRKYNIKPME